MPNLRLYDGDMHVLLSLLKSMDGRMSEFESAMAAIIRDVRALQPWPPLPDVSQPPLAAGQPGTRTRTATRDINTTESAESVRRSAVSQHGQRYIQPTTDQVGNSAAAVSLPPAGDHLVRDWAAAAVFTTYASANRFAVLGFTTTDDDDDGPQHAFV